MPDWSIAEDIGPRLREIRDLLGETQAEFAKRFGRGWKQVGYWERGQVEPPRSVLEWAAEHNFWPVSIFAEGGPRPSQMLGRSPGTPGTLTDPDRQHLALQSIVNGALADVMRWKAEGLTIDEAATRAVQLITTVAQAARADAEATAEESADLIRALHRQIGILGEGRAAGSPAPPAKAAGAE